MQHWARFIRNVALFASLAFGWTLPAFAGSTQPAATPDILEPSLFAPNTQLPSSLPADSNADHYGLFNLLDHRSVIGTGLYPEPFLVDEGDVDREVALTWAHQEGHHAVSDFVNAEIEWSFDQFTFELEAPYIRDYSDTINASTGQKMPDREEGIGPPSIAVRHPLWEWVSSDASIENAVMPACEIAFPSNSRVGKTTELVPGFFDLLRIGDHFGLQTHAGYSTLYGDDVNNQQTFEYSADFSYNVGADQIPLPRRVLALVPMFELAGERPLNRGNYTDSLTGVIGGRINLENLGAASPRLGVGYIFPVDKGARDDFSWGVVVSLVFDL